MHRHLALVCLLALAGSSAGCASNLLADTQTIHNREATRIWVIHRTAGMSSAQDEVVYCDAASGGAELCRTWSAR